MQNIQPALDRAGKRIQELASIHRELLYVKTFYSNVEKALQSLSKSEHEGKINEQEILKFIQNLEIIGHNMDALQGHKEKAVDSIGNSTIVNINKEVTRMIDNMEVVLKELQKAIPQHNISLIKSLLTGLFKISDQLASYLIQEISA